MRRIRFTEDMCVMEDDGTIIRSMDVHMVVGTENVEEEEVLKLIGKFSLGIAELLQKEDRKSEIERSFEELNEKLMHESEYDGKERWF